METLHCNRNPSNQYLSFIQAIRRPFNDRLNGLETVGFSDQVSLRALDRMQLIVLEWKRVLGTC